jgi:hypothetical protein
LAQDAWDIGVALDGSTLVPLPAVERDADSITVSDGVLAGDDNGEFGGAIWWHGSNGKRDTLRVEGRDSRRFYADNLRGFIRRGAAIYALVGLSHMGLNDGELLSLSNVSGKRWHAQQVLDFGAAASAYTSAGGDTVLVLTTDSLYAVELDPVAPNHQALYGNPVWRGLYASSVARDRAGSIYIGMRSAIGRLTATGKGYREDWLVPNACHRRVPVDESNCRCESAGS